MKLKENFINFPELMKIYLKRFKPSVKKKKEKENHIPPELLSN